MSVSKIFFYCSIAFIAGVGIVFFIFIPFWLLIELFLLAFLFSVIFFRYKNVIIFALALSFFSFGVYRIQIFNLNQSFEAKALENKRNTIENLAVAFKRKLTKPIYENLSYPASSILSGILIGQQSDLDYEWKRKMNITGTKHITAVSGMNVVLLSQMLVFLGVYFGLFRQHAIYLSLGFIWIYVFLIGGPSSAIRAGIMASLLLVAMALGRQNKAERAIVMAGAVMLFLNPSALKSDLGFQLSFLSTLGIIYLSPFFKFYLRKLWVFKNKEFSKIAAETFSAQIFTIPLVGLALGSVSLIAPLANLLIVPFIPIIMVCGFILVILGFLSSFLAFLFSFVCNILMSYLVLVIDLLSRIPLASISINFSWVVFLILYIGIIFSAFKVKNLGKETFW